MKEINQTYTIQAPVSEVYEALTSAEMAERWGAAPASVNPTEGGEFSYWGGDIHGVYTELIPNERIVQDWYGHDNPDRKFRAVFTFEQSDEAALVHLNFSGDIEDEQKDITDWQEYYFNPIKALLEEQSAS
jgi:activator of HSP90 ATPase